MNDLDVLDQLGAVEPAGRAVIAAAAGAVRSEAERETRRGSPPAPALGLASRPRRWVRNHRVPVAAGAVIAVAAAVFAGIALGIGSAAVGPNVPKAFASWEPAPTKAAPGQESLANAACAAAESRIANQSRLRPVLDDIRGPYTLVLMASSAPSHGYGACLTRDGVRNGEPILWSARSLSATPAKPGALAGLGIGGNGKVWVATGEAGPGVTGVSFAVPGGSVVRMTVTGGVFAGWWPSHGAAAVSVTVTSSYGTVTDPFPTGRTPTKGDLGADGPGTTNPPTGAPTSAGNPGVASAPG